MSDSDSDDSNSSSDIAKLLEKNKQKVRQQRGIQSDDSSGSEEDDESDEDMANAYNMYSYGNSKKKRNSVEARLAEMDQEARIKDRQRSLQASRRRNLDSDDEDEDEDDVQYAGRGKKVVDKQSVKVQVDVRVEGEENQKPAASASKKAPVIDIDDSSSDDDDALPPAAATTTRRGGRTTRASAAATATSLHSLNGVSAEALAQLEKNRKARLELQQAQQYHAHDVSGSVNDALNRIGTAAQNGLGSMTLNINATFERTHGSSSSQETTATTVLMWGDQLVSDLITKLREQLKLNEDAVVTLQCNGVALHPPRSLSSCEGIHSGCTIDALILVTTFEFAPTVDYGKAMTLVLRRVIDGTKNKTEEQELEFHEKEPFSALVQQYRQKNNVPESALVELMFDGDRLGMNRTPKDEDMESDDLIDVKIS